MLILSAFLNSSDIQLPENVYFCRVNINFEKVTTTFMEMRTISTNFECVTQHGPNLKRMAIYTLFRNSIMLVLRLCAHGIWAGDMAAACIKANS